MEMINLLALTIWKLIRLTFWTAAWVIKLSYRLARRLFRPVPISHGSARWARLSDLTRGKALGGDRGIIVGKKYGQFIRYKRDGAVMVCAPMGRGKGVGIVVPNLLSHPGSALVTDPKGENYAVTHAFRRTLGPVRKLNAINSRETDTFNPFDMVRVGTDDEPDDIAQIADFLVIPDSLDKHWDNSAKNLLAAVIRYVIRKAPEEQRNLAHVHRLVSNAPEQFEQLLTTMASCGITSVEGQARLVISSLGSEATTNIISNAGKALDFWAGDRVAGKLTLTSNFSFMDLLHEGVTIYVMVPDDKIEIFGPFLRMMTGCALTALMRGKHFARPAYKPLLMLDECKALGRLEALDKGMGMLREYCHTVTIWQDYGQLRKLYGEDGERTFMAASGAHVIFGISEGRTARDVADDLGRATILSRSYGTSEGSLDLIRSNWQEGRSETGRLLRDGSELLNLAEHQCVIRMPGQVRGPILANKVRYYEERCWRGLWGTWRAPVVAFPALGGPGGMDDQKHAAA